MINSKHERYIYLGVIILLMMMCIVQTILLFFYDSALGEARNTNSSSVENVITATLLVSMSPTNTKIISLTMINTVQPSMTAQATATQFPTSTIQPTATIFVPSLTPIPTLIPAASGSGGNAVCSCSSNSLNCGDFSTHNSAQACYDYCKGQGVGDIHKLDGNNDGNACESLP